MTALKKYQLEEVRDFKNFLWVVWEHLQLPPPTDLQYDIADYLQECPKRCVIEAFRGCGKSFITSAFVVWALYWNPTLNILVVSASKDRSDAFTSFTLRLIKEIDILHWLVPQSHQRQSAIGFDVAPAPAAHTTSIKSLGINSQLTGNRADIIIGDDCEVANNSLTVGLREKLSEQIKEFDAIIKPDSPIGKIIMLGTPQHSESIYVKLQKRGYECRIWPARYLSLDVIDKDYDNKISPYIINKTTEEKIGQSTEPVRFTDLDLSERELSYGRSGFALQFLLNTRLSDADRHPLKINDLIVSNVDKEVAPERLVYRAAPENQIRDLPNVGFNADRYHRPDQVVGDAIKYTGSILAIDPSGRGQDETGYAVVKILNGFLHVPECGGIKGGYEKQTLEQLARIAERNSVNGVIIEENFGSGMYSELMRPVLNMIHPCALEEVRHSKQKERRIVDTLEPVLSTHRLVIDPFVIKNDYDTIQHYPSESRLPYSLMYQLSHITLDKGSLKNDDRLDALAIGVNYFTENMGVNAEKRMESRRNKIRDKELRAFMKHAVGKKSRPKSWIKLP